MMYWEKLSKEAITIKVNQALSKNIRFDKNKIMGTSISFLDPIVFDKKYKRNAPFLTSMIHNPDHRGCHTINVNGSLFEGTKELELDVIRICAEELLGGQAGMQDGYIASGGTEANITALWIFRNLFKRRYGAKNSEIVIFCSRDTHYSIYKASNLLGIDIVSLQVDNNTRQIKPHVLEDKIASAKENGKKYFIFVANMGTTMFGSVDDIDMITSIFDKADVFYKVHVDAAFGGFIYPFTNAENELSFANKKVASVSLDAHKMLQTPYGTGMFLIRKGYFEYLKPQEKTFFTETDLTLSGSRSGASAIAIWMVLMAYGSSGLREKVLKMVNRTKWLCEELSKKGIDYYNNPYMNIVSIRNEDITKELVEFYNLVPDNHESPNWWKVVTMAHVDKMLIGDFLESE